jgi:hypothetical protein
MKFTAAILASLYLFIALHSAMTVLHFNINQQEIKTELCKYKDMTIPLCGGGVCYLQEQLSTPTLQVKKIQLTTQLSLS